MSGPKTLDEFFEASESTRRLRKSLCTNLEALAAQLSEEEKDSLMRCNLIMIRQGLEEFGAHLEVESRLSYQFAQVVKVMKVLDEGLAHIEEVPSSCAACKASDDREVLHYSRIAREARAHAKEILEEKNDKIL